MQELPSTVPIDQSHTRFILSTYTDAYHTVNPNFEMIKSSDDFLKYLDVLRRVEYEGTIGNNIQRFLMIISV